MKKYFKNRKEAGFSLAETLMAVALLSLATGIVASGMSVVLDVYYKSIDVANAQVALSTTVTVLRDELSSAKNIEVSSNEITYVNAHTGVLNKIFNGDDTNIKLQAYANVESGNDAFLYSIVSDKAITDSLNTSYDSVRYENGLIIIEGLKVTKKGNDSPYAKSDEIVIRAVNE